ncbi:ATP-binding protein [Enorma massiliensis]|uniref:ATP-binding protein n=1 Tax=Enorma massiliensis TaxID=1472761 RepID=UPI003AF05A22
MTDNVKAAEAAPRVPKRVAAVIINSLKGGVVPRIGLPYITVGREAEIRALLTDLSLIADGGASFRFLVGRYGSGKSFLLQTIRTHAMGEGFVVADADLSPERRLQGGQGQGLATYRELMRNLSTKTRPEGGALMLILDRWISNLQTQVAGELGTGTDAPGGATATGGAPNDSALNRAVEARIREQVASLEEMVHGFDFARLLTLYYRAVVDGNDELKGNVARWFRGEYRTKSEARQELGVSIIIGDDDWYDYVKLFAQFLKGAGYQGMLVLIDELVNLYKIPNSVTRQYNYEKILTMYNDTLQGKAHHLGIIMGGTPQSIEDRRRGVFSYEALRSRLTQGRFAAEGMRDMLAPIIHLHPLTYEELLVLIEKLQQIHAGYFGYEARLNESDLVQFLQIEFGRVGADTHLTPREVIRDFIELLDIAYQNPSTPVASILSGVGGSGDGGEGEGGGAQQSSLSVTAAAGQRDASEFAEFKI